MLKKLLSKGYLPSELPPIITSESLSLLTKNPSSLSTGFTQKTPIKSNLVVHNLARVGGLRRKLAIPNPINFYRLSNVFVQHEKELSAIWSESSYSQTKPTFDVFNRRALTSNTTNRFHAKLKSRRNSKYLLKADISQFYPSLYTHAISWALHTKPYAKANKSKCSLLGNLLDKEVRDAQDGQTKGIPIGPDTSLGIAEILLCKIDKELETRTKIKGGTRYIDDIELSHETLSEAEHSLRELEQLLQSYELQLNVSKTKIIELPHGFDNEYTSILRPLASHLADASSAYLIAYFDQAFALARANKQDGVLRYAVGALKSVTVKKSAWIPFQELLWQSVLADSGCLRLVLDILLLNKESINLPIDSELALGTISFLINTSSPVGHGSEILWGLWASLILDLKLDSSSQELIGKIEDDCIAATAMSSLGKVFDNDFQSPLWESWLIKGAMYSEHWLFSYEAMRNNWHSTKIIASKLNVDVNALHMKNLGIRFIDITKSHSYIPNSQLAGFTSGGSY